MAGFDCFPACLTCGLYRLQPPLVQACFHGDAAELKLLINRQEDVNYQVAKARVMKIALS